MIQAKKILFFLILINNHFVYAEDYEAYPEHFFLSQNTHGGIGLIQNPTGRFSEDGEFTFGISTESPYSRIYSKMQFFPWLEAVLKYTEGTHRPYARGAQTWKDKGIDIKLKLSDESDHMPAVAIGFNDFGGVGLFSSEYIVASKAINNFDFTLGLGWGRLGDKDHIGNPFSLINNSKDDRGGYDPLGGTINFKKLFSGEKVAFFGGVEYFTPIKNLSLKLEYDSSLYSDSTGLPRVFNKESKILELDSPFNFSLDYKRKMSKNDIVNISMGMVRGNAFYANFSVHSNLNFLDSSRDPRYPEVLNIPYLKPYNELNRDWQKYLTELIMWQMGNEGMVTHNLIFNEDELLVEISQGRFRQPIIAIDFASRILANNAPKNISKFTVINVDQGVETLRASIDRDVLVEAVKKGPAGEELFDFNSGNNIEDNSYTVANSYLYPNFYWEIKPHLLGTIQHQQKFYFYQLEALIHTEYSIRKGLYLTTDIGINISNNYEDYTWHRADGQLYHVRQNRRLYLTEGESGLRRMALDYNYKVTENLIGRLSVGYLEWMYGGLGGEFLYIPDNKDWAIGLDAYWVKQRDFDQKFSFQDYDTVTGFISFYYDLPFYDLRLKTSAGRFLAEDKGVHIDLSRRFNNGSRVGAIVALTDCDSDCVGEGSFNKWIYFTLPMDPFYTRSNTRSKASYAWSPLTKDAGQKVEPGSLYNLMTHAQDEVDILRKKQWSMRKIFAGFGTSKKTRDSN